MNFKAISCISAVSNCTCTVYEKRFTKLFVHGENEHLIFLTRGNFYKNILLEFLHSLF